MHSACFATYRNKLVVCEPHALHVLGVDQNDIATILIAIQIVVFVNHGVELAFASNRHHSQLVFGQLFQFWESVGEEFCSPVFGIELRLMVGSPTNLKLLSGLGDSINFLVTWYDFRNPVTDRIGFLHLLPIHGRCSAEHSSSDLGNNTHLAAGPW